MGATAGLGTTEGRGGWRLSGLGAAEGIEPRAFAFALDPREAPNDEEGGGGADAKGSGPNAAPPNDPISTDEKATILAAARGSLATDASSSPAAGEAGNAEPAPGTTGPAAEKREGDVSGDPGTAASVNGKPEREGNVDEAEREAEAARRQARQRARQAARQKTEEAAKAEAAGTNLHPEPVAAPGSRTTSAGAEAGEGSAGAVSSGAVSSGAASAGGGAGAADGTPRPGGGGKVTQGGNSRVDEAARAHPAFDVVGLKRVDQLAVAMQGDPVLHRYLPPIYQGFDMDAEDWVHKPVTPRPGGLNMFKVCIAHGAGSWDQAYAWGLNRLFQPGLCFDSVIEKNCDQADVVIFNEGNVLWHGAYRDKDNEPSFPPKAHPNQVYVYYAHEAAGSFGWDLKGNHWSAIKDQIDYVAYFDQVRSAVWWPFGPTLRSMLVDFKYFDLPREKRIPGIMWLAVDCLPLRTSILREIGDVFPVFSVGTCENNAKAPVGLPPRGSGGEKFQGMMADYMFYFALENGGACPGYATEKLWLALSRGSIPIYFGTDDVYDMLPNADAIVDLKKFNSPKELADRLYQIATDDKAYWEVHKWRYQHPTMWNPGFRKLLRTMSTDAKYAVCDVLQKGHSKAQEQLGCRLDIKVMGRTVKSWKDTAGNKSNERLTKPLKHLRKNCDRAEGACWSFINPEAYNTSKGVAATAG